MATEFADDIQGNRSAQAEEMEVLQSIYGDECFLHREEHFCEAIVYPLEEIRLMGLLLRLRVYFPDSYPSTSEPVAEVEAPWLGDEIRQKLDEELRRLYSDNAGNVVVFTWIEWLKEQEWLWQVGKHWLKMEKKLSHSKAEISDEDEMGNMKDDRSAVPTCMSIAEKKKDNLNEIAESDTLEELDKILGILHGASFTERKSTFQAHLAHVSNVDQVETVMDALLRNRKIAGATHNIMAYRIGMPEKGTVLQDYDDDGETAAGGRLLHLLQIVDASNVVVVVSRWFGGVLLGPDRFKHINNAARSLLGICGYIKGSGQSSCQDQKLTSKPAPQKGKKRS